MFFVVAGYMASSSDVILDNSLKKTLKLFI